MVLTINKSPQDTASLLAWAEALRCVAFRLEEIAKVQGKYDALVSDSYPDWDMPIAFGDDDPETDDAA